MNERGLNISAYWKFFGILLHTLKHPHTLGNIIGDLSPNDIKKCESDKGYIIITRSRKIDDGLLLVALRF